MRRHACCLLVALLCAAAAAQQPPVQSPLLDHLVGEWVMQGTLARKATTHDVTAEWVLDHHYVRVHEVSREKTQAGKPQYEATIYIAWNESPKHYACVWLDVYGGLAAASIGRAEPRENELPFIFKNDKGQVDFTNSFIYDAKNDTWEWRLDNVENGVAREFGRLKLIRKRA